MGGGEGLSRATATALVTTGSEILKRLEQLGPSELLRLNIDELHALLVNADPQASIPKPNKKTWQEKASPLPTFQAALSHFFRLRHHLPRKLHRCLQFLLLQ